MCHLLNIMVGALECIPTEIGKLTCLRGLKLQWNELTGVCDGRAKLFCVAKHMDTKQKCCWMLVGPIPAEICQLRSVEVIRLFQNKLTGDS